MNWILFSLASCAKCSNPFSGLVFKVSIACYMLCEAIWEKSYYVKVRVFWTPFKWKGIWIDLGITPICICCIGIMNCWWIMFYGTIGVCCWRFWSFWFCWAAWNIIAFIFMLGSICIYYGNGMFGIIMFWNCPCIAATSIWFPIPLLSGILVGDPIPFFILFSRSSWSPWAKEHLSPYLHVPSTNLKIIITKIYLTYVVRKIYISLFCNSGYFHQDI